MTLQELNQVVNKYLLLADPNIVKFLCAVAVANRMPMLTPTWVFLVGASSGGKSSLLEPFHGIGSYFISDLTAKTLFSSMKSTQGEAAAIMNMPREGGMVLVTDFTLILEKDELVAKEIMSQFRLIYDGSFKKLSGNNGNKNWEGRFGLILGVTTAVYEKQQQYAAVGERMVYYYFNQPDREDATIMALGNLDKTAAMKAEIAAGYASYINSIPVPKVITPVEPEVLSHLIKLAEMATRARSSVSRNKYRKDMITQINALEMPMRMAKQLLNVAQGLMALNGDGQLHEDDRTILYKTAIDSIPKNRKDVMETLTGVSNADVGGIAVAMGLEYEIVKQTLADLAALGVVKMFKSHQKGIFYYELKQNYRELVSKFQHIEMTNKVLEASKDIDEAPLPEEPGVLTAEEQVAVDLFSA